MNDVKYGMRISTAKNTTTLNLLYNNYLLQIKLTIMKLKKFATLWIISLVGCLSKVYAVTARTFKKTKDTADHDWNQIEGSRSVLDMISLVNKYLWFAIWFFCFVFMIWNWYKLITAAWDDKAMWSAKKALLWSGIWIAICLLAYIIVNLAVKLFA